MEQHSLHRAVYSREKRPKLLHFERQLLQHQNQVRNISYQGQNQIKSSILKNFDFLGLCSVFGIFNEKMALYTKVACATLQMCRLYMSALAEQRAHSLSYTHLTLSLHNKGVTYMNTFKSPKLPLMLLFQEFDIF